MPDAAVALTPQDQVLLTSVQFLMVGTTALGAVLIYFSRFRNAEGAKRSETELERSFKHSYLIAYFLAMLSDWLQGPYVYALYAAYGFSKADNGLLFIFGFGSSGLFGTFIGGSFILASILGLTIYELKMAMKRVQG